MNKLPLRIKTVHFTGIGGIGMSGIAEILASLGYSVQGSDASENANVKRLRSKGITVHIGQKAENLGDAEVLVYSSAIKSDNPEVIAARQKRIPVIQRAEMLGELMRFKWSIAVGGTHGKTTTTSLVASILVEAGIDPTVINGGIINAYGSNARLGDGNWMVVEADESDGSFTKLPATIGIVTNIEAEHMEHYGSFDNMLGAFDTFVNNLPFYGLAVVCADDSNTQKIIHENRRFVSYGIETTTADLVASNIDMTKDGMTFDLTFNRDMPGCRAGVTWKGLKLSMVGKHNVLNSLAAIATALELGVDEAPIRSALAGFEGVKRRFTKVGVAGGVTVIDDYGHHPTEIASVLKAAKQSYSGKIIAVVQPHRYSRLKDLFDEFSKCFDDCDELILTEVYTAGEEPNGTTHTSLAKAVQEHRSGLVHTLEGGPDGLAAMVNDLSSSGDCVICLGAGSITQWANALPAQLEELAPKPGSTN